MKEVIIDGVVYVPKEADKENNSAPSFKVGEWIYLEDEGAMRIESIDDDARFPLNLSNGGSWEKGNCRLATDKEIETYLIDEAGRRGFKEGARYHALKPDGFLTEIDTMPNSPRWRYGLAGDSLDCGDGLGLIYKEGRWAKIVKEPRPLPKTVEELEALLGGCIWAYIQDTEESEDVFVSKFVEEFR